MYTCITFSTHKPPNAILVCCDFRTCSPGTVLTHYSHCTCWVKV